MTNISKPFAVAMSQVAQARRDTCASRAQPLTAFYWEGYRDAWVCLAAILDGEAKESNTFGVILAALESMGKLTLKEKP